MGFKDINSVINGKIENTDIPEINNINSLKLYNQRNDLFELKSILEIEFQLKDSNEIVLLKCIDVNDVKINTDINYEFDLYLEVIIITKGVIKQHKNTKFEIMNLIELISIVEK